jgi:hypothetical protein
MGPMTAAEQDGGAAASTKAAELHRLRAIYFDVRVRKITFMR